MRSYPLLLLILVLFSTINFAYSQTPPPNDLCQNAKQIVVSNNGFGTGMFISDTADVTNAKRETAEKCVDQLQKSGNCSKTVWYTFYIGTTRNVSITLKQRDSSIPEIFIGFQIYKSNNCDQLYGNESEQLSPINKFGLSGNSCLTGGWYTIQVGANQRASGKVWIELNVSLPSSDSFDNQSTPFVIKQTSYLNYSECNSSENYEYDGSIPADFTQTIWTKVIIDSGYNYFDVLLRKQCYYKLFKALPSITTIQSTAFEYLDGKFPESIYKIDGKCLSVTSLDTIFIMFLTKPKASSIQISINKVKAYEQKPTPWNSSLTPEIIDLTQNPSFQERRSMSCEATLSQSHCAIIPKEFTSIVGKDTQHHQNSGYQVVKVEDGLLTLNFDGISAFVNIYQGDISQTCNLTFWKQLRLNTNEHVPVKLCIKKGTYTLVYAYDKSTYFSKFLTVHLSEFNASIAHEFQTDPDNLGSFDPNFINKTTDTLSFTKTTSTVKLDGVDIEGRLSFKEIYFAKPGSCTIIGVNAEMYLFEGRASAGTVKKIEDLDYTRASRTFGFRGSFSFFSGEMTCFQLKSGYYTIVCVNPKVDTLTCENQAFYIKFIGHPPCPFVNNDPIKAERINDNKDIIEIATKLDKDNYSVTLTGCSDCISTSTITPLVSCPNGDLPPNTVYRYYTFSLSRSMSLNFQTFNPYPLFVGNCVTNPNLVLDSSKRISSCSGGVFCNLLPNTIYSIVIAEEQSIVPPKYELVFSEIRQTQNDFITNSMDLGHFAGSKSVNSQETNMSCHTNGLSHELPFQFKSYSVGSQTVIKYPATPNTMVVNSGQTTWFTYTAEANTNVILKLIDSSMFFSNNLDILVYKYLGNNELDWQKMLAAGFDSSKAEFKLLLNYRHARNPITIVNESCETARYFICVFANRLGGLKKFQLQINSEQKIYENDGDFCHEAKKIAITQYGNYEVSTYNLCHTFGNSPFEDKPENDNLASTWFEIDLSSLEAFDLSLSFLGYFSRYNVYAGNCGALTKITFGKSLNGYFDLPCMGAGKYYVQIFGNFNRYNPRKIGVNINVQPKQNKGCKPFDFKSPVSYFEYTGGCSNQDTLHFTNLSTQGSDVQYSWWLNNQLVSNSKEPFITRNHPSIIDSNQISLIVVNNITGLSDTSTQIYVRDTASYFFKLSGPKEVFCYDTSVFESSTNFNRKLAYQWSDIPINHKYYSALSYSDSLVQFPNYPDRIYYLHAKSENCIFYDSIQIPTITRVHKYFDTTLCQDQVLKLEHDSGVYQVNYARLNYKGQAYVVSEPGTYKIGFKIKNYCYYQDTITVSYDYGPRLLTITDSIYDCNTLNTKLSYNNQKLANSLWSTGDTSDFIEVNSSGKYSLTGDFTSCRSLNYTALVTREIVDTKRLKDSSVCQNITFELSNPYPKEFEASSPTPVSNKLVDNDSVLYVLSLKRGRCVFNDTSIIRAFPNKSMTIDSQYCDTTNNMALDLDGKNAISYDWFLNGSNNQFLRISDYGSYSVARIDMNQCKDTITYNIINSCPDNLWIPNIFSPNQDLVNDTFKPYLKSEFNSYHITIYNRWGQVIHNSGDAWDGKFNGNFVPDGVYGYTISIEYTNGPVQYVSGTVRVIK